MTTNTFAQRLSDLRTPIIKYARTLCRDLDLAEEIAADTILAAWQHRDRFEDRGPCALKNWTFMIARNRYFTLSRHDRFQGGSVDDLPFGMLPSAPANQEARLHLADVAGALDRLQPHYRDALIRVGFGDDYAETAEAVGCGIGTVKSRVWRGRELLRGELGL